jgi:hypothetical protein
MEEDTQRLTSADVMELRIVEGVASMAASKDVRLAEVIEAAMSQAVKDALAAGISMNDTAAIRARMLAYRDEVKRRFAV